MTDSRIGGDFAGLQAMGTALTGAVTQLEGVVRPLTSGADNLVHDAGWQGDAATAFRAAWTKDSLTAGGFSELVGAVGTILTTLGTDLANLNEALHSAADMAGAKALPGGDRSSYSAACESIMQEAQRARIEAATALQSLYDELDPEKPLATADKIGLGIFLRDVLAIADDSKRAQAEKANRAVDAARAERTAARSALDSERSALAGRKLPTTLDSYKSYRASVSALVRSERMLGTIEDSRDSFSKFVNFKTGDIDALSNAISKCRIAPDFLKDLPVVDAGAALFGSGFEAGQDHDEGWSWTHTALVDGGAALGGVVAGVAVAALLPEEAATAAAAAGATTGLIMAVGVDKLVHEHWSEDIHDHGVLGGLGAGASHVAKSTYNTVQEDLSATWRGITGLF